MIQYSIFNDDDDSILYHTDLMQSETVQVPVIYRNVSLNCIIIIFFPG